MFELLLLLQACQNLRYISERELLSHVRLSSVCNAPAPYSGGSNFRQYFYGIIGTLAIRIFYGDRPRGTPPPGELNTRGSKI